MFVHLILNTDTSHFHGGSITYKPLDNTAINSSEVSIIITQTYSYTWTKVTCTNSMILNQTQLYLGSLGGNGESLNCLANCSTSGGYVPIPVTPYCTDYSTTLNLTVGQRMDMVNISANSYFTVAFISSNSNKNWNIACTIDLRVRPDGFINTPPVASMISPIAVPAGIRQYIPVPTLDADNDYVQCRFSTKSPVDQCGDVCATAALPTGTIVYPNCTFAITGVTSGDLYSVAIQVEDFYNSSTSTPFSSVPVQFLISVYSIPSCALIPTLTSADLPDSCTAVQAGQPYSLQLFAKNNCGNGTTIKDIGTLSFPIVSKSALIMNATADTWYVTLTWTPTILEIGAQVLCAVAVDSKNVQSDQYCITFMVVAAGSPLNCPGDTTITR
ncbi:unnamed protein product [Didymodactylos carnosus]|uniref:Uncharacterized protein n=1 Tax=Didymodactylos carnosus TaxID=1234261 RepID=A0A814B0B3_9BILA|nr:unnamed protein product [Didymodactylos carnosus]CAF3701602.1 unnamed protein product [Didymodactylos carnosus]